MFKRNLFCGRVVASLLFVTTAVHAGGPAGGGGFHSGWGTGLSTPARVSPYQFGTPGTAPRMTGPYCPSPSPYPPKTMVPLPCLADRYVRPVQYPAPLYIRCAPCCE